jgi:hypothetical protein
MSHRPLDILKKENKAADRHPHHRPHRRHRSSVSQTDQIDALDTIGGGYHHGGPYDATLMSRNLEEKYSPLAAVRDSNMEAIRATPKEFIQDSLQKHVPLQGTATIPNGGYDLSGNPMTYSEGADLMREADAPGGAYKRWDGIPYHPDDLKGKGEPSYTIERDAKKMKGKDGYLRPDGIEMMVPQRQRSYSNAAAESSSLRVPGGYEASDNSGINRSNTTGKKLSEGLKRRFGSMRRKKDLPTESVH